MFAEEILVEKVFLWSYILLESKGTLKSIESILYRSIQSKIWNYISFSIFHPEYGYNHFKHCMTYNLLYEM
jgi:hypothetical protein